jgi:trk system potassium uptake protein TrkH
MHFLPWRRRSLMVYWRDSEGQAFVAATLAVSQLIALFLLWREQYADFWTAWRLALFNTVSIATTTGYASIDYNLWPTFAPALMLFLSYFATCAGRLAVASR